MMRRLVMTALPIFFCIAATALPIIAARVWAEMRMHDITAVSALQQTINEFHEYPLFTAFVFGAACVPWLLLLFFEQRRRRGDRMEGRTERKVGSFARPAVLFVWHAAAYTDMWAPFAGPMSSTSTAALSVVTIPLLSTAFVLVSYAIMFIARCRKR
jgi:hypothetical protein